MSCAACSAVKPRTSMQSHLANHIILSLGEIDYKLTHVRGLMSKKNFDLKETTDEAETEAIMIVEKKPCYRAVKFLTKCCVQGQNVSILCI